VQWASPARESAARLDQRATYVAFDDSTYLPFAGPDIDTLLQDANLYLDWRELPRLSKFPNNERPANLANFVVGGDTSGAAPEFDGYVDEVSMHTVGGMGAAGLPQARGALILAVDFDSTFDGNIQVNPAQVSLDGRRWSLPGTPSGTYLGFLRQSGLLVIDGEYIAYNQLDISTGEITIAPQGRGRLGTEARGHGAGARVWIADGRAAVALNGGLGFGDEVIPLDDFDGFSLSGMILVDEELIHAPVRGPGFIGMPRGRERDDGTPGPGTGLLRGRFGTDAADHADGTVLISFPNRWMDNYIPRADSGAGAWLQFGFEEPQALWRGLLYETELPDNSISVRALVRTGPARWTDDPRTTPGLAAFDRGSNSNGGFLPLGFRHDRLDLRLMFDWGVGSFDPVTFGATGWTMEPRLRKVVVDYLASSRVESNQEILE
jgi:hypothetical protein